MKIFIDGLFFNESGIGRYYECIVKELLKEDIVIYTCVDKRLRPQFENNFSSYSNMNAIYTSYSKFSSILSLKYYFLLKKLENIVDLFFFPHINLPIYIPLLSVVVVHDMRPYTKFWDRSLVKQKLVKFLYKRSIRKSALVVCVSQFTKNCILLYQNVDKDKIKCVYEFVDDKFYSENDCSSIIDEKYILFVGNRKSHKNIISLLKAFQIISDKVPHKLVIAGRRDTNIDFDNVDAFIDEMNLSERVVLLHAPADEIILKLYSNLNYSCFLLFSRFWVAPMEAVASGCPAILSDIPIFREIFEDSGLYFDPLSPNELSDKIFYLLSNDKAKAELLNKQKERLKFFEKKKIITRYLDIFESLTT
jgi:glycosyltransferase involved in cell wall biosynthesis